MSEHWGQVQWCVVPLLLIWELIKGFFSKYVLEFFIGLRYYALEVCQTSPSCFLSELLEYCLSHLDLFLMLTHEVYKESITLIHII